jgi:hypothetical protein
MGLDTGMQDLDGLRDFENRASNNKFKHFQDELMKKARIETVAYGMWDTNSKVWDTPNKLKWESLDPEIKLNWINAAKTFLKSFNVSVKLDIEHNYLGVKQD